ncbi:hypothetical protein V5799_025603 [Amblyomma americanum]|uniref:Uncharacterized protein n=1 Tax=Amblyomma americanum TaxID=6943 RepID=A0AAQ4E976_AMBAM
MSPVEGKADKTHPVGDAREGMTDFCAEPQEHEEKGGSPCAGVQCELSLRIDMEAVRRGCFTNDAGETSKSAVAASLEAQVSQLTRADSETADTGTSNAKVERLPYGRSAGVYSVCVLYREQNTETRQKFATHAKSRHDFGVHLPMQPEGLASSVKTLQQLSTQSMKASENMALSIVKARGLSALTANEGRKLDRQQRKWNVTALTACAAPIFGRRRRVRVFEPGGRR